MISSIYDIREDEIKIEGKAWDDEEVQRLAIKSLLITKKMVDYWEPFLKRGEDLFKKYEGEIIDDYQRAIYEDIEKKIVIEPPIMKSPIRALLGHIIKNRRSGAVSCENGGIDQPNDRADEAKLVTIVMKDMEKKTKEHLKDRDAIHDSLVACYPNVLLWKKQLPTDENPLGHDKDHLAWNSCVFGPVNINAPDMSDVTELVFFDKRSQADLELNFPKRVEQIREHWKGHKIDDQMISSVMGWAGVENASYRDYMRSILDAARGDLSGPAGMLQVFQRIFQIRRKEEVWVSLFNENDYQVIPEDWPKTRKEQWIKENEDKYAGPVEHDCITLWLTVFTASGLVLANEKHWFQENGKIPADFRVPAIINGKPSGPAVDMDDDTLRNCVSQIEYLDDMRKGGGTLAFMVEGALTNPESLPTEASRSFGVATINKDFFKKYPDISKSFREVKREPSKAWGEYAEFAKNSLYDTTRINEAMQGESAPRQADIAKRTEIEQALIVNALYLDNFNAQRENTQNLKLALLPYLYDQHNIPIEGYDEDLKEPVTGMANVPQYDAEGNVVGVLNDITSHKYYWRVDAVDNSPSAKAGMMQDALNILNSSSGPLMQGDPSGEIMADFWSMLDNPVLQKAGKKMAERAKAKSEAAGAAEKAKADQEMQVLMAKAQAELMKARKAGVTLTFTGEQLMQYPALYQIYMSAREGAPVNPPAQQQPVPAGQPASVAQPQGETYAQVQ